MLSRVEGNELALASRQIKRIAAGEIYKVEVDFDAPRKPGHYFVVLQHKLPGNNGARFGEKVSCDFVVEDAQSESSRLIETMRPKE